MQLFWLSFGFGLVTASVLAIAAVGLSLQFGITNYINFAYGDFMALGAYITYVLNNEVLHWNIWIALVFGSLAVGVIAVILSQLILSPFARRFDKSFYVLIVTFGLSLILLNVMYSIWGATVRFYNVPINRALHIGPMLLTAYQMIVIDTKKITTITWFLSGTLAGLAGSVLGLTEGNLTPSAGELFLFVIFAAVIVGGVGSIYGAMAGAVLIGLATEVSAAFIDPAYKLDIAFIILILTLLFRPSGLFARQGRG